MGFTKGIHNGWFSFILGRLHVLVHLIHRPHTPRRIWVRWDRYPDPPLIWTWEKKVPPYLKVTASFGPPQEIKK